MTILLDSWYCAGWSGDLADSPKRIKIANHDLVLYRDTSGTAIALSNRCPHRFASLAEGKIKGDSIECPYHGLRFDRTGACVLNPHGRGIIPPSAKVDSFVLAEKHSALWVWLGNPALADPNNIIDISFVTDPRYVAVKGQVHIKGNYQLLNDNLLDLTHAAYIHPTTVGLAEEDSVGEAKMDHTCTTEGNTVHSNYGFYNVPPTAQFRRFFKKEKGDLFVYVKWVPASSILLDLSMSEPGVGKGEIDKPHDRVCMIPGAHLIVPETEDTSHYFYAMCRHVDINDKEGDAETRALAARTFNQEDAPMIERCHELMEGRELFSLQPVILETDKAGVQARRILAKLIARETGSKSA
jgi:phenylpropionate dioxygenase-like ring-hydroxylating dioxygenase large terminal subunit